MDLEPVKGFKTSQPAFLEDSQLLIDTVRKFSVKKIMDLMEVSEDLAKLNHQRFQDWSTPFTEKNAKPAVLAFTGDVYEGLKAPTLKKPDLAFAQKHLRILSGLYGLLAPLDLIQPYRLEMGRVFKNKRGKNLYEFWGNQITEAINEAESDLLVNLASNEYFKSVKKRELKAEIVTPVFKDEKKGKLKVISFFAKKARGAMARFIIENRIQSADALKEFNEDEYTFDPKLSSAKELVFTRPERPPAL